jgi:catechol 2,3-dioxygenase-like lactoylglutathione lyase family enzyme
MASVRYLVHDVGAAVDFYVGKLGFQLEQRFGPAIAIMKRGDLTFWAAGPVASAARPMPGRPEAGAGRVESLRDRGRGHRGTVAKLKAEGVPFRNDIVEGPGGKQILCEDPSGNVVELFEPA